LSVKVFPTNKPQQLKHIKTPPYRQGWMWKSQRCFLMITLLTMMLYRAIFCIRGNGIRRELSVNI